MSGKCPGSIPGTAWATHRAGVRCPLVHRARTLPDEFALSKNAQSGSKRTATHDSRERGLRRALPFPALEWTRELTVRASETRIRSQVASRETPPSRAPRHAAF